MEDIGIPLFAPIKETDNSTLSSRKEMKSYADVESALKCFDGKEYWQKMQLGFSM